MNLILSLILLKVGFVIVLLLARVNAFTVHYCLAGRIYWQWKFNKIKVNHNDVVYTLNAGPISFLMVR